jgi:hypothetical protein
MPLTADDRYIRIKVKIERAKKCLRDLEAELSTFGFQEFYSAHENNPMFAQSMPDVSKSRILPFHALAIAGDVVHNLRSALDYLAYQLVWVGSDSEPSFRVAFPISIDAAEYERNKARKVEGMCPKTIKAIDALKPYKGGNDALWRIHSLDNIDKHRTLITYAHDCYLVADWLKEFSAFPYLLKAVNPDFVGVGDAEQELENELREAGKTAVAADKTMLPSLGQLIDYVDHLVLTFKPFLR